MTTNTTKPTVKLIGRDGNAFAIIGACSAAAKKAGWSKDRIDAMMSDMMSGDYSHVLYVASENFKVT